MEGYAVEQGFLNLLGSSNEYFFGQFEKVSMEDIKGTHFVNAEASFDLRFRDCSISFARSVGDVRPIYLCQYSGGGSISNLCFDGGSIHDVRGFFGADVQPGSVMQIAFEDDTVGVLNTSFENKTEGTGFKHLVIHRPIGNSLINISLDAFERYNLNSFDDYGTNYGFKKIKRIIHHYDTIWDDYPSGQLPLRDLIRDIGGKDEYQQNNKAFVLGEVGKSPSVKTKVDSFAHLTAESAHVIEISDFFPPYQTILGVGLSHQEQLFTLAEDRDNNSAHIGIGDQYDRFRWGFKPVGANHFYDFTQRAKAPSMTSVIYDKPESLFLSAFCMSPDDATLIDNILILGNPWFVESDEGKVFEFLEGELTGLEMTVINFIDSTHVEVTASMFSTIYPAAIIQQIDWIEDKAIVLTQYSQQGNYNEVIPGGRYANWFNELPIIT